MPIMPIPPSYLAQKVPPPAARDVTSATPNSDQRARSFSALDKTDSRYVREYNNTTLTTTQGKVVIDDLDVPEDVKQLLFDLDFDYSGEVSKEELKDMCTHLMQLHAELGEGASNAKINELLELIIRQVNRKKTDASFMEYSHLPAKLQKCFNVWDLDKDGRVDAHELMAAADAWQNLQKESALMKKLLLAACIVVVLMFAGMFAMGLVTAEMAKEFKAGGSGDNPRMTSKSGDTIQVASSDTQTDGSGVLLTRAVLPNNTTGRNILGSGAATVATQVAKTKSSLVSTLPDSFFGALKEVTLYSEKGHTLSFKIQGYARIPLKNSRCGNVVKMYTSVDGAIVLDSGELSFEDKLHDLFKNAGFEVAVGGAAGRRLANMASVDGFFDHISKMESEGSWKCGDIPLPHMPTHHIQKFDSYTPCIEPNLESTTQMMNSCDSMYGGKLVGTTKLPAEHASATLSRLDKVRDALLNGKVQDPTADKLYTKTSMFTIVSPAYTIQRTSYEAHPAQDLIRVTDLTEKKSVSFQQMHSGPDDQAIRNFCKNPGAADPVIKDKAAQEDPSQDTSVHFEYVGLESEGDKVYRRFRLVPSKDFSAWMGSEGVGKVPSTVYHYWDDANSESFTPYRLVSPGGDVVVYTEMSQTATDEDAEVFLKNTINATKFGIFTKPYKLDCDETEKGATSAEFGIVPEMINSDLSADVIKFYARYMLDLASDGELHDVGDTGDTASLAKAMRDGADTRALLDPVYTFLETVTKKDPNFGFAQHALLAHGKLSMASVCSTPCAAARNAVQVYMTENDEGAFCDAPKLQPLVKCIDNLNSQIRVHCMQSKFWLAYQTDCGNTSISQKVEQGIPPVRRLQQGQAEMHQLPDGTHSLDLGSLDQQTRMHLSGAISASQNQKDASFGDLNGYALLHNASNMEKPTPNALLSGWESDTSADSSARSHVSRRLVGATDCSKPWKPGFCIMFTFPKPGASAKCSSACGGGVPAMDPARCSSNIATHCKLSFKVAVAPPYWLPGQAAVVATGTYPKCQFHSGGVWAFCGTTPYARWVEQDSGRFHPDRRHQSVQHSTVWGQKRDCSGEYINAKYRGICDSIIQNSLPRTHPGSSYGGSWTISVELGGAIEILEKMFGIYSPPSPLYGTATMTGGIIFKSQASCPSIPFYLEGYASISFAAGVNVYIARIDLMTLSLKVGVKIAKVAAHQTRVATDRRRGGGWLSDRRRHTWAYTWHPLACDVEVYARVEVWIVAVKGWLLMQYYIFSKTMKISAGVEIHINLLFHSWCEGIWSQNLYNAQIR